MVIVAGEITVVQFDTPIYVIDWETDEIPLRTFNPTRIAHKNLEVSILSGRRTSIQSGDIQLLISPTQNNKGISVISLSSKSFILFPQPFGVVRGNAIPLRQIEKGQKYLFGRMVPGKSLLAVEGAFFRQDSQSQDTFSFSPSPDVRLLVPA